MIKILAVLNVRFHYIFERYSPIAIENLSQFLHQLGLQFTTNLCVVY